MRAKQIVNIIEGFKLGSLGAGVKFVPDKEQTPKVFTFPVRADVKIMSKTWMGPRPVGVPWVVAVKWKESNGIGFLLRCAKSTTGNEYRLTVFAGSNLKIALNVTGYGFTAHKTIEANTDEAAEGLTRGVFKHIELLGSFGYALATGDINSGWYIHDNKKLFYSYLMETSRVKDAPYFSVAK